MLKLQQIVKDYQAGDTTVHALRGVSLQFRESEFVAILGHSGCGKTTLLNIIGGLDHYTKGDLIIGGRSTKDFSDADWDSYRVPASPPRLPHRAFWAAHRSPERRWVPDRSASPLQPP